MSTNTNAMESRNEQTTVLDHVYEHLPLIMLVANFVGFFAVATFVLW